LAGTTGLKGPLYPDVLMTLQPEVSLLQEHIEVALVATDDRGRITYWDGRAEGLLEVDRDHALGRDVGKVLGGRSDGAGGLAAALRAGEPLEVESLIDGGDGPPRLCHITVAPLDDSSGRVGAFAVVVDVTEGRRAERRLRAQYAATRALADSTTLDQAAPRLLRGVGETIGWHAAALWIVDADGEVIRPAEFWTADDVDAGAFEKATKESAFRLGEGLPGRVWSAGEAVWVRNVQEDPNFPRLRVAAKDGLQAGFSFPIRLMGNVLGSVEFFHRRSMDPDPDLMEAMEAVGTQVGQFIERARALDAARISEANKTAILESVLDCVISIDRNGRIVEFNPAAETAFGYAREEVVGRNMVELLVPARLRDEFRARLVRYLESGQGDLLGRRLEMPALRRGGGEFPVELTMARVSVNGASQITVYLHDLSERRRVEEALREGEQRLRQALEAGNMGVWDWNVESGTVAWSPNLERLHGLEPGTFDGTFESFLAEAYPEDVDRLKDAIQRALEGAEPYRIEYRVVRPDGVIRWLETRGEVRRDQEGRPYRMTGVCTDVTGRREAEEARDRLLAQAEEARERLAFLAEASVILSASLSVERTLEKLAGLIVPTMSDWCSIDMLLDGSVQQMALAHVDPERVELARELRRRYPPDRGDAEGLAKVLRTGQPTLYPEISDDLLVAAAQDEEHLHMLRELELQSAMVIPLVGRGRVLGSITFVSSRESGRRYDEGDLSFAEDLARRAAVAVDNARLYQERSAIARTLQRSLLPPSLPEMDGFEVAARYQPTGEGNDVGGDFYDVFERARDEWVVVIGDVCGKGPEAAALTGLTRYTLRATVMKEPRPSRALAVLNDVILREGADRFCTAALGRLIRRGQRVLLTVSCGGHPRPHVLRRDGVVEPVGRHGTLLGSFPDPSLSEDVVELFPGDAVIFYTDGLVEDRDPATAEHPKRLRALIQRCAFLGSAEGVADCLQAQVRELHPDGPRDDVAIVVLRVDE
jgi:PAS domain S-box-containing protein